MRLHAKYILPYEPCSTACRDAEARRRGVKQRLLQREFELGLSGSDVPLLFAPEDEQDLAASVTAH
jgi:hypothetical protein